MQHRFRAYYSKQTTKFHITLDIEYELYEEMSDSTKSFYGYNKKTGRIIPDDWDVENGNIHPDFRFFFGDFLVYTDKSFDDTEKIFDLISDLFHGLTESGINQFKVCQLHKAKFDYIEYLSYNNFSLDFLERFANSKGIHFNRTLTTKSGQRLSVDSDITDIWYVYESQSIEDIIFSSVHFALQNGYKFAQCQHCGKWFFKSSSRKDSNTKYCKRNSPVPDYAHLNCEQAVRNIKQQCTRVKNRIETKIQLAEKGTYSYFIIDFQNQCEVYKDRIKECPTVENLTDYMSFLDKVEKDRGWLNNGNNK